MKLGLRQFIAKATNNAAGDALKDILSNPLRAALRVEPPHLKRPFSRHGCFSDLFPWRRDGSWQTKIDIMNLPSLMLPQSPPDDDVLLIAFDNDGRELVRETLRIAPFSTQTVLLNDMVPGNQDRGSFACFHKPTHGQDDIAAFGGYIVERQYIGLRHADDPLWSFVHGNYHGLFQYPGGRITSQVSRPSHRHFYRPQLRFDDSDRTELIYANNAPYDLDLRLTLRDDNGQPSGTFAVAIPPNGMRIIDIDNRDRRHVTVEGDANTLFLRPLILKHYPSHFNVLHS